MFTRRSSLALALVLFAAGSFPAIHSIRLNAAQAAGAWFGVALPPAVDLHRPPLSLANAQPAPAVVPAGEEKHQELQGARIRQYLEGIIKISRDHEAAGDKMWGRITGLPSGTQAIRWAGDQFKAANLQGVEVQEFDGTASMWLPKAWEVRLIGSEKFGGGSRDVVLQSALPTSGAQITGGTLTAGVVFTGLVSDPVPSANIDLKGKVAVQKLLPTLGAFWDRGQVSQRARQLAERGAIAVLNVIDLPGNTYVRDYSSGSVPTFNLGGADGAFLQQVIERASKAGALPALQMKLSLQTETLNGLKAYNAVGTVRGRSNEVLLVNAHADGYFEAAGDNGDGLAVLIALARHFGRPENRPERTLVFVASAGHHGGGMNGATNFVRMNPAIVARTLLVLNLEHIAQLKFRRDPWKVEPAEEPMDLGISNMSPSLIDVAEKGRQRYGFALYPDFSNFIPGDLGGYGPLNVPRVQAIHAGPLYHTSGDVLDTISVPGLERAARFYAYFLTEAAKLPKTAIDQAGPAKGRGERP